jgi:hypothetical protein
MGCLESSRSISYSTSERSSNVSKQFALQKTLAQRTTVHFDKRACVAIAKLVDRIGNHFFAGACFAQ